GVGIRTLIAVVARRAVGERGRAPRHGIARVRGAGIAVVAADRRAPAASRIAEVLARAGVAVVARPAVQQRRVVHAPGARFVAPVGGAGRAGAAIARHSPAAGALITHATHGAGAAVVAGLAGGLELARGRAAIAGSAVAIVALLAWIDVAVAAQAQRAAHDVGHGTGPRAAEVRVGVAPHHHGIALRRGRHGRGRVL